MSTFIDPWLHYFDDDISSIQRHLLIVVASYIGTGEWCWPTQGQLAAELGCTITTVNRGVRALAQKKCIDCQYTTRHGRSLVRMRLNKVWLSKAQAKAQRAPVSDADEQP